MIFFSIFVVLALAALVFFWMMARGHGRQAGSWEDLPKLTEPVDLVAFRNLTDPKEDAWLRGQLPRHDYLAVRRERMAAAADYLGRTSRNAAILSRLGQAATASSDPALAEAGRELVNTAAWTRLYTFQALVRVHTAWLFPELTASLPRAVDQYQRLLARVDRVGRMQSPVLASRIASSL